MHQNAPFSSKNSKKNSPLPLVAFGHSFFPSPYWNFPPNVIPGYGPVWYGVKQKNQTTDGLELTSKTEYAEQSVYPRVRGTTTTVLCVCVCVVWHEFLIRRRRKDASTCRHKQSRHATWRNNDVWKWRFAWRPPRHATRRSPPNHGNAMAYPAADRPLFLPFLFLRSSFLFFSALCLHPHSCAERQKIIINVNKRC